MKHTFILSVLASALPLALAYTPCRDVKVTYKRHVDTWAMQIYTGENCAGAHDWYSHEMKDVAGKGHSGCIELVKSATHVHSYASLVRNGPKSIQFFREFNCSGKIDANDEETNLTEDNIPVTKITKKTSKARSFVISADYS